MKREYSCFRCFWLVFGCILLIAISSRAVDGDLDTSFAQRRVFLCTDTVHWGQYSSLALIHQSSGKIVAASSVINYTSAEDMAIFRFDPATGALDPTFGEGDGVLSLNASGP